MRKFLASLLAAALLCTACVVPAAARETSFFKTFPQDVPASALVHSAPSDTAFTAAADKLEAALKAGTASNEELAALLTDMSNESDHITTEYAVCMIDYYRDSSSCSEDNAAWAALQAKCANRSAALLQTALASKYKDIARSTVGDRMADNVLAISVDTPEQLDLLSRKNALMNDYWTAMKAAYTASIGGQSYTSAQLEEAHSSGKLTEDQYKDGDMQITKAKNAAAAPILTSLVKLYNEYAVSKGYKNYAEYAYGNVYKRDFTTADAQRLETYVKKYIVPVAARCKKIAAMNSDLSSDQLTSLNKLTQQQVIDLVRPNMDKVSSEYAKLFDYMTSNKLCDLEPSEKKLSAGFTVGLPQYHSAYIYNDPDGNAGDVGSLIHEFGHFAQNCLDKNGTTCNDVAEIDSQGLEALYLEFVDTLAGEAGGDVYRSHTVRQLLGAVVEGCLYDEFQQKVYENGNMSVAEMNRLFYSLSKEYGEHFASSGDEAYDWVDVHHTFQQPFYYLGYATSAAAALELLTLSQDDFNSAGDKYLQLVADSGDYSYKAIMSKEGLPSVFEEKTLQTLAADALRYMENEVADVPAYTDLTGHWFESGAKLAAAEGIMTGDGTRFAPEGQMTRAMFVTVLYRTLQGEKTDKAAFSDVTDSTAWYYDAVNWAAAKGIAKGTDGKFLPNESITRQDMAALLARALGGGETAADESVLKNYADKASIADYARGAVTFATQNGLMQGSAGSFGPTGVATRAQAGQVFVRVAEQAA